MTKVKYLNPISTQGTALWTKEYETTEDAAQAQAIMVRSASMHDMVLPDNLLAVARAGAGVNNIPLDRCAEQGIVVFNTPGANARSVMELALCGMLLGCRDIVGGINWVKSIKDEGDVAKKVEKGKGKFAGHEISQKRLGVIGLGAIGGPLANAARKLGMEVYGCDPTFLLMPPGIWIAISSVSRPGKRSMPTAISSPCTCLWWRTPSR